MALTSQGKVVRGNMAPEEGKGEGRDEGTRTVRHLEAVYELRSVHELGISMVDGEVQHQQKIQ